MTAKLLRDGALRLKENFAHWFASLENQTLLISGGSGLIGSMFISVLLRNVKTLKFIARQEIKKGLWKDSRLWAFQSILNAIL